MEELSLSPKQFAQQSRILSQAQQSLTLDGPVYETVTATFEVEGDGPAYACSSVTKRPSHDYALAQKYSVVVKNRDANLHNINNLESTDTVQKLKSYIQEKFNVPIVSQRLFLNTKELTDNTATLAAVFLNAKISSTDTPTIYLVPAKSMRVQTLLRTPHMAHAEPTTPIANISKQQQQQPSSSGETPVHPFLKKLKIRRVPFEKVTILEPIGCGSFKTVYRATFGNTHPITVAVLKIRNVDDSDSSQMETFNEAKILTYLMQRCPNDDHLFKFFGYSRDESAAEDCFVCEFAKFGSMDSLIWSLSAKHKRLPEKTLLKAAGQIRAGMQSICGCSVLHRDLALRNVLCFNFEVNGDISVKICDFGRAVIGPLYTPLDEEEELPLRWCAPEVILKQQFSEKSEVWSFGVTLWELVSEGMMPFEGISDETLKGGLTGDAFGEMVLRPPQWCRPESILAFVLNTCLCQEAESRPTFLDLLPHFESVMPTLHSSQSPRAPTTTTPTPTTATQPAPTMPTSPVGDDYRMLPEDYHSIRAMRTALDISNSSLPGLSDHSKAADESSSSVSGRDSEGNLFVEGATKGATSEVEALHSLMAMGFDPGAARLALKRSRGCVDAAVASLLQLQGSG